MVARGKSAPALKRRENVAQFRARVAVTDGRKIISGELAAEAWRPCLVKWCWPREKLFKSPPVNFLCKTAHPGAFNVILIATLNGNPLWELPPRKPQPLAFEINHPSRKILRREKLLRRGFFCGWEPSAVLLLNASTKTLH